MQISYQLEDFHQLLGLTVRGEKVNKKSLEEKVKYIESLRGENGSEIPNQHSDHGIEIDNLKTDKSGIIAKANIGTSNP